MIFFSFFQGTMMAWIGAAGSLGRILFPLLSGLSSNVSFLLSVIVCVLSIFLTVGYHYYIRLKT
jgi:hypothetical protein